MRLSFSTNGFVEYSVFEAVERIAEIGYEGVELLADTPHLYADTVSERDLERVGEILAKRGISAANINANTAVGYYGRKFWEPLFEPSLANPDRALRLWRLDYSKKCIDMARFLGASSISVTSGRLVPGVAPKKSMELLRGSLGELLEYAEKKAVRVGIEYEPGLLIECCAELLVLLDQMNSNYLGANLDLGHSHVLGEDAGWVIGALGSRIFHIHIEDIRAKKHYHLVPGTGDMDFSGLFGFLDAQDYKGFATVELYTYPHEPEEAARQSLDYLKSCLNQTNDTARDMNRL